MAALAGLWAASNLTSVHPTRFDSIYDLARLPWFDIADGHRLVVDPAVGPIIDMHTHVAIAYLLKHRIDVMRSTPRTAYYLPLDAPIDLDLYSNANLDDEAMFSMKLDMSLMSLTPWGKRATHTAPNLLRDMDDLGIVNSVILPFDLPFGPSNANVFLDVAQRFPRLLSFGSVHPRDRDVEAKLTEQIDRGARGMKLHPNGQFLAPDAPPVVHFCGRCGARDLPVLFHCGPVGIEPKAAERRSQANRYERTIAENPGTTFVLGHSGALQHRVAIEFAAKYPNTWFELSCLGLSALREVLEVVPPERVLYGTDWPFYHQSLTMARLLIALDGEPERLRSVFHDNASRLLGLSSAATPS